MPVAHVAKAMGMSRQCAHRWVAASMPRARPGCSTDRHGRTTRRRGRRRGRSGRARRPDRASSRPGLARTRAGVARRTVSRILRRHHMPRLSVCDPLTGEVIRASKTTAVRYERERPGELVHMDVKKIGRIPDGGGWRAHGREMGVLRSGKGSDRLRLRALGRRRPQPIRLLRDPRRRARPDQRRVLRPCPRAFHQAGITTSTGHDRQPLELHPHQRPRHAPRRTRINHVLIRPHCPWQNGKVERFNRTLQNRMGLPQVFTTNDERTQALAPWLDDYNTRRRHSALGGLPPISRLSPT